VLSSCTNTTTSSATSAATTTTKTTQNATSTTNTTQVTTSVTTTTSSTTAAGTPKYGGQLTVYTDWGNEDPGGFDAGLTPKTMVNRRLGQSVFFAG